MAGMGGRLETAILVACTLPGCQADVSSSPATSEAVVVAEDGELAQLATVTREEPVLSQSVASRPPQDVAFARVTIARNENPELVPVYFEVFLYSSDPEPIRIGSFAPYPPDREQAYLLRLPIVPQPGDRLELRMSFTQPDPGEDVEIGFLPIELIDRESASRRR